MQLHKYEEMIFALLRYALNGIPLSEDYFSTCSGEDWKRCYELSVQQGVMAVVWDAVIALPSAIQPPKSLKINWAFRVEAYSKIYRRYCQIIRELSDFYMSHGIATVQLKGVGLSNYYPVPERRQGGDIDIYTYSKDATIISDKEANELADKLMKDKGIDVDIHTYKHSNFLFHGIPIENHKCFLDCERYHAAAQAEKLLHSNFRTETVQLVGGEKILVPSPEFNGIFVTIHALQHLTSGLCLHHLCDIASVLKKTDLSPVLSLTNKKFTSAVRSLIHICNKYLGTDVPVGKESKYLSSILINEILRPKFHKGQIPGKPISLLWYKTRRFIYTQRLTALVWDTSISSAIWQSFVSHITSPKTILMRGE